MARPEPADIDVDLLEAAGFRIEGPDERGRYWWTLYRNGWSGIECGPYRRSFDAAVRTAARALLDDEDIDWGLLSPQPDLLSQFPDDFCSRLAAVAAAAQAQDRHKGGGRPR